MKTKRRQSEGFAFSVIILLCLFVLSGCKKDKVDDQGSKTEVNEYLVALPSWSEFSPYIADDDKLFETTQSFNCANKVVVSTTACSITRTPQEIVTFDPNSEILYLGSLIQGDGYLGGLGSLKSLPIYQRAPLSISISFQMSNNSREVENPNLITVKQAVAELVEAAQNSGHVSGSSIFFDQKTSHSLKQTALALGLSVNYMAAQAQSNLQWQSTSKSKTVSAYFVQKMFTVSMGLPQRPADLFNDQFTQAILDEQIKLGRIGPNNLPVFVSNIVYGRMMTLTMTSTFSEMEMKAALEASYGAINGSISAEHLNVLQNSTIRLVTIGGNAQDALDFLRTGQLGEFFKQDAPLTTAVPISYTLRNVGDNNIAKVSQTASYNMVQTDTVKVDFYKNEAAWKYAVQANMTMGKWETNKSNVQKAEEAPGFSYHPNGQIFMGKRITYKSAKTSFPFDFHLENKAVPANHANVIWALVFEDREGSTSGLPWPETISIGDIDDFENDDFEIWVSGNNVYAIGFIMVDNSTHSSEFLEVHAIDGAGECQIGLITHAQAGGGFTNGFIGVVSPVPIRRIFFDEDSGGDDIGIKHFYFGYKTGK